MAIFGFSVLLILFVVSIIWNIIFTFIALKVYDLDKSIVMPLAVSLSMSIGMGYILFKFSPFQHIG